jgi:hypothetical protein
MGLFGIGNLLLKFKRKKVTKTRETRGIAVVTAFVVIVFCG